MSLGADLLGGLLIDQGLIEEGHHLVHEIEVRSIMNSIEHVMPRGWRTYWGDDLLGDSEGSAARDVLVDSIGNLTLVTKKLNGTLSNRPWRDDDALVVAPKGADAGIGKRSLIGRYSLLVLNKEIVDSSPAAWTEDDIRERSTILTERLIEIWPYPGAVPA